MESQFPSSLNQACYEHYKAAYTLATAMKDGINVHGAMAQSVAAEDGLRVALREYFAEAGSDDKKRLDWLEMQCVSVRTLLPYGSLENFSANPGDGDGETFPSDIRQKIDESMRSHE